MLLREKRRAEYKRGIVSRNYNFKIEAVGSVRLLRGE